MVILWDTQIMLCWMTKLGNSILWNFITFTFNKKVIHIFNHWAADMLFPILNSSPIPYLKGETYDYLCEIVTSQIDLFDDQIIFHQQFRQLWNVYLFMWNSHLQDWSIGWYDHPPPTILQIVVTYNLVSRIRTQRRGCRIWQPMRGRVLVGRGW